MRILVTALSLLLTVSANTFAETPVPSRSPDVIYVPTPPHVVDVMLQLAEISKRDLLYDLGSGDGRIVITAAKRYGARGIGIDIDAERIAESKANARREGVTGKVKFIQADLFETDLRPATAVTLYLLSSLNQRLRPKLFAELRPGTPVVSHDFDMGDWQADQVIKVGNSTVFFWRIPAEVGGEWALSLKDAQGERRLRLQVDQTYQKVHGLVEAEGEVIHTVAGRLDGEAIELSFHPTDGGSGTHVLTGRVGKDGMSGKFSSTGNPHPMTGRWSARRTAVVVQTD